MSLVLLASLVVLMSFGAAAAAQTPAGDGSCHGERIDSITFNPGRPPFEGSAKKWRAIARAIGLHHATTRADVLRTYILLKEGDVCTDQRRTESARILRDLPFLAAATVIAIPDSAGCVRLDV